MSATKKNENKIVDATVTVKAQSPAVPVQQEEKTVDTSTLGYRRGAQSGIITLECEKRGTFRIEEVVKALAPLTLGRIKSHVLTAPRSMLKRGLVIVNADGSVSMVKMNVAERHAVATTAAAKLVPVPLEAPEQK